MRPRACEALNCTEVGAARDLNRHPIPLTTLTAHISNNTKLSAANPRNPERNWGEADCHFQTGGAQLPLLEGGSCFKHTACSTLSAGLLRELASGTSLELCKVGKGGGKLIYKGQMQRCVAAGTLLELFLSLHPASTLHVQAPTHLQVLHAHLTRHQQQRHHGCEVGHAARALARYQGSHSK